MKAAHDYLWPDTEWHRWTEWRFREHCEGWKYISYAGGAASTKSYDAAKIGCLFWLANPKKRAVVIASTTLASLETRIWGYATRFMTNTALQIPYRLRGGNSQAILNPRLREDGSKDSDTIHGMFAIAAKQGSDEKAISGWIGRHPEEALMLILDEGTDMPPALFKALPNLERGIEFFQAMVIGNSNSKFDLHGLLSTPKEGWETIDPLIDKKWETSREGGVCLFFSCYDSPAITEPDKLKKNRLGKFLITAAQVTEKENEYGKDSDDFYRFVLGFWRSSATDGTVVSKEFLNDFSIMQVAEWSGRYPLQMVAGLDPAFSTGGDQCLLRLAILGIDVHGNQVLDYRGMELLFKIQISATLGISAELQIAQQVIRILAEYNCPLHHMAVDATGQGRAIGEVIRLEAQALKAPIKIYTVRQGGKNKDSNSFDIVIKNSLDMWNDFRPFIQNGQIKGMDKTAAMQLYTRRIKMHEKTLKTVLEGKKEYRTRMGGIMPSLAHSPDEADAAALALQAAMMVFGFRAGNKKDIVGVRNFAEEKLWVQNEMGKLQESARTSGGKQHPVASFKAGVEDLKPFKFNR